MKTRIDYDQAEFARVQEHKKWKKKFYRKQRYWIYFSVFCYLVTLFTYSFYRVIPAWAHAVGTFSMGITLGHTFIFARQELARFNREEHGDA